MRAWVACTVLMTALFAGVGARAQTVEINPALAKLIEGAKREGTVLVSSSPASPLAGSEGAKVVQSGMKEVFDVDIPVQWTPGGAFGPAAARALQEMQAGTPASSDILQLTPVQVVPYLDKGLFRTVDWAGLLPRFVKPAMVEADGRALRVVRALPAILYNVKAAPWVAQVNTSADLLRPSLKGKFVTTSFLTGFDVLLADDVWGVEKTEGYIRQFAGQIAGFASCGTLDRIASGEIEALALDCSGGWPNTLTYRGTNVVATKIVNDIAQLRYFYVAIPTHAAHPNAATLYTLYLDTPQGQKKAVEDLSGFGISDEPGTYARQVIDRATANGAKFVDVTVDWWKTHPGIEQRNIELSKIVSH